MRTKVLFFILLMMYSLTSLNGVEVNMSYSPNSIFSKPLFGEEGKTFESNGIYLINLRVENNKPDLVLTIFYEMIRESGYEYISPVDSEDDEGGIGENLTQYNKHLPKYGFLFGPKINYFKSKYICLYTDFQLGLGLQKKVNDEIKVSPFLHYNALGIKLGNDFAITTEVGVGVKGFLIYGFSYKF